MFFRRMIGRRRWPVVDGTVVDKRHLTTREFRGERTHATISYDEYLVEVPGPGGEPVRLRIEEDNVDIPRQLKSTEARGKKVRVHVNGDATKAVFAADPREDKKARKRRDEERQEARDAEAMLDGAPVCKRGAARRR